VPEYVKSALDIIPMAMVDEALARALTAPLTPIEWTEDDATPNVPPPAEELDADLMVTH